MKIVRKFLISDGRNLDASLRAKFCTDSKE